MATLTTNSKLLPITSPADIPSQYRSTPIADFLEYHNLDRPFNSYTSAEMLIGMCMDNRKHLRIPDNFSFIIRAGGANLRYSKFKVSYAIAVGGAKAIAIIGHTQCGMCGLHNRKEQFIEGMIERAGWTREQAERQFEEEAPKFEIGNEAEFVLSEVARLRKEYPKIIVAPMIYDVADNKLYIIKES